MGPGAETRGAPELSWPGGLPCQWQGDAQKEVGASGRRRREGGKNVSSKGTACARALSHLQDVAGETLQSLQSRKCPLVSQGSRCGAWL